MRAVALVALLAVAALSGGSHAAHLAQSDVAILQFALNLEYLEAEFYSWAAWGKGLPASLRGKGPASVGGRKARLSPAAQAYAIQIAHDEVAHVKLLRAVLGAQAVDMPAIDIGPAFAAAADAAFNTTLSPRFDPYANDLFFYHGAFIFEDVGVTAYKGAAPLVKNKDILAAAAGLLGTEAYHAGAIRAILLSVANMTTPYMVPVSTIVQAISDLRDAADGPGNKDAGLFTARRNASPVPVLAPGDSNKIAISRTPAEVISIVTFGGKGKKGGFFPKGLNGYIR